MKFLDKTGLRRLWLNIISLIDKKIESITTDDVKQGDNTIYISGGTSTENID